jgi:hypothetical protein
MAAMSELLEQLCDSSRRNFKNIYQYLEWPNAVDAERDWFTSPELVSLHGTDVWAALPESAQKRLAFWEAVNFFSLNIRGESGLMQGLAERLYQRRGAELSPYLHHFLDEENKHCVLFGTFCTRYAGKIYEDRKLWRTERELAEGESDLLFFAKVLIFEEIVDRYNLAMSKDERLHATARAINLNHHLEEARHLAFGRQMVQELWERYAPRWAPETIAGVRAHLTQFLKTTWREYYNPEMYEDAGVLRDWPASGERNAWDVQEIAWSSPASVALRRRQTERCAGLLKKFGILEEVATP